MTSAVPRACPSCGNVDLLPLGFGTQRLERVLAEAFPARAHRARRPRQHAGARARSPRCATQMTANELDILIGTQMLAKGHDFPRLTLVGVLGADNALYSADFRATERLAALLMQVAGRAGRAGLGRRSHRADGLSGPSGLRGDSPRTTTSGSRTTLLAERKMAQLPPFTHVAVLAAEAHHRADVDEFLRAAHAAGAALARQHARGRRGLLAGSGAARASRGIRARAGGRAKRAPRGVAAIPAAVARGTGAASGPPRALGARRRSRRLRMIAPERHRERL